MRKTLEKLWSDYLEIECAEIDTEEERALVKKAADKHGIVNDALTKDQKDAIEAYVDALCEIHSCFSKKAFFKGCEFAVSFLLDAWNFKKG